jgi:CPA1 family monovalent cation:H+ antiporter
VKLQYLFAVLVCVTAVASYINHRFIKLPKSIGLTVLSLGLSVGIMLLLSVGQLWVDPLRHYLGGFNFSATVIDGMLSYLLFAGAMNINALELSKHKSMIAALATGSVLISCLLIGYITYLTLHLLGLQLGLMPCLLFGALIAPTDPICVLSMMRRTKVPNLCLMMRRVLFYSFYYYSLSRVNYNI